MQLCWRFWGSKDIVVSLMSVSKMLKKLKGIVHSKSHHLRTLMGQKDWTKNTKWFLGGKNSSLKQHDGE